MGEHTWREVGGEDLHVGVLCLNDGAEGAVAGTIVEDSRLRGIKFQSVAYDVDEVSVQWDGDFLERVEPGRVVGPSCVVVVFLNMVVG